MSKPLEEQLSALLDGELPAAEVELLLARLDRDRDRRDTLGRYAMIGECIRTGAAMPAALQVAERVRAELDDEAAPPTAKQGGSRLRGGRLVAAIAASLALVAVLRLVTGFQPPEQSLLVDAAAPGPVVADTLVALEPMVDVSAVARRRLEPRAAARLTTYLMAHSEYAGTISRSNFDSRLVSARAEQASWQRTVDASDAR